MDDEQMMHVELQPLKKERKVKEKKEIKRNKEIY